MFSKTKDLIIDCHTHLNRYEDESKAALPERLEILKQEMKVNKVDVSLVLSSYRNLPGRPSIQEIVHALRDEKNIFAVAGMSFNHRKDWDLGELREYIKSGIVKGLKFYCGYEPFYPSEPEMLPLIEIAKEFQIPIMIHCGDTFTPKGKLKYAHPLHVDDVAVDHPEVNFVICHLGNPWLRDAMEVTYKNKNVYTDISGLVLGDFSSRFEKYMLKQLEEMITFGMDPSNILYGTDWPISSMKSYLKFVKDLNLSDESKRKILGGNAKSLFKLS